MPFAGGPFFLPLDPMEIKKVSLFPLPLLCVPIIPIPFSHCSHLFSPGSGSSVSRQPLWQGCYVQLAAVGLPQRVLPAETSRFSLGVDMFSCELVTLARRLFLTRGPCCL